MNSDQLHVRPAIPTDIDSISTFDPRRDLVERAISTGSCHVAILSNRIIGYGILDYRFYDNGFIDMVFIDPAHRRHGVGAAILRYMESICTTDKLFTSTNLSNLPMQALLSKLGYRISGVIHHLDEGDPEIVYVKFLQSADQNDLKE